MGKVKTIHVSFDGINKKELEFKYDVSVNTEGEFTTTLPEDIARRLEEAGIQTKRNRLKKYGFFAANTLIDLEKQVSAKCELLFSKELIFEEIFLRYSITTCCSYIKDIQGNYHPNGSFAPFDWNDADTPEERAAKSWRNGTVSTHASNPRPTSVSVYVSVVKKKIYKYRDDREQTIYQRYSPTFEDKKERPNLHWVGNLVSQVPGESGFKEVPYNETNAAFFRELYISMWKLNELFLQFTEPENLIRLAESKFKLLGN